jgi:hypothetical protein
MFTPRSSFCIVGYEPQSRPAPEDQFVEAVSGSRPGYAVNVKKSSSDTKSLKLLIAAFLVIFEGRV